MITISDDRSWNTFCVQVVIRHKQYLKKANKTTIIRVERGLWGYGVNSMGYTTEINSMRSHLIPIVT